MNEMAEKIKTRSTEEICQKMCIATFIQHPATVYIKNKAVQH